MRELFRCPGRIVWLPLLLTLGACASAPPAQAPAPAPAPTPDAPPAPPPPSYTAIPLEGFADGIRHFQKRNGQNYDRHDPTNILAIAENILRWQRANGGWPEDQDPTRVLTLDEQSQLESQRGITNTSFGNRNIFSQVEYLAAVYEQTKDPNYLNACLRGLEFMLSAQYPHCGGFPHSVPGRERHDSHITIVGEVTTGALSTLRKVAGKIAPFQSMQDGWAARAASAVKNGNDCLVRIQVTQAGLRSGWAGHYDQDSLAPTNRRDLEFAPIGTIETVAVVRYLMSIEKPSAETVAAIEGAIAWLHRSASTGPMDASPANPVTSLNQTAPADYGLRWARFYDFADNHGMLASWDGFREDDDDQPVRQRWREHDQHGTWPAELIGTDYPRWKEARRPARGDTEPVPPPVCITLTATKTDKRGHLSDADERATDTARIQQALDTCGYGRAVSLQAKGKAKLFLSGPLRLRPGVSIIIEAGTSLWASRNPRDYDVAHGSCGVVANQPNRCQPLILVENAPDSGLYGEGAIDGRGGASLIGQKSTWWEIARDAKDQDQYSSFPTLVTVTKSPDFTLHGISLRNSPTAGVWLERSDGFVAYGVKIKNPKTARNTEGIAPSSSSYVTITRSFIDTGDDNVAIQAGTLGPSQHVRVTQNQFYSGHGMSIGGEIDGGAKDILVQDLTLDGTDYGLRIQADHGRGGLVRDVRYENVCMQNVPHPISFDTKSGGAEGDAIPVYRNIVLRDIFAITAGAITFQGFDKANRLGVTLDNVFVLDGATDQRMSNADIVVGPRLGNLLPSNPTEQASLAPSPTLGTPIDCGSRFVPFPDTPDIPNPVLRVPADETTSDRSSRDLRTHTQTNSPSPVGQTSTQATPSPLARTGNTW